MKTEKPSLVIVDAMISNGAVPKTCGDCRFWVTYKCLLKPTLRCSNRNLKSRGCPIRAFED